MTIGWDTSKTTKTTTTTKTNVSIVRGPLLTLWGPGKFPLTPLSGLERGLLFWDDWWMIWRQLWRCQCYRVCRCASEIGSATRERRGVIPVTSGGEYLWLRRVYVATKCPQVAPDAEILYWNVACSERGGGDCGWTAEPGHTLSLKWRKPLGARRVFISHIAAAAPARLQPLCCRR